MSEDKPALSIMLVAPGEPGVMMRLPGKGKRWQGPFEDMGAAVRKAIDKDGLPTPADIEFVGKEDAADHNDESGPATGGGRGAKTGRKRG